MPIESIGAQLDKIIPRIKKPIQLAGLVVVVGAIATIQLVSPGNLSATISAGSVGVSIMLFGQILPVLRTIPESQRTWALLLMFAMFCLLMLGLVIVTKNLVQGPGLPIRVDGRGPLFSPPTVNSGRTLDACIDSPQFPAFQGLQCIQSAQKIIATAFCNAASYNIAASFETTDTRQFQMSVKFREHGGSKYWTEDNTGGAIFTKIVCRQ